MRLTAPALAALTLIPVLAALAPSAPAMHPSLANPLAVIAHIDTGINPYHETFRDTGPLAFAHPSTYLPGYPADAPAVWLSLDEADYATAVAKDAAVLAGLRRNTLYWFPGTRIVGAISFGAGGTDCAFSTIPPLTVLAVQPPGATPCTERILLDDHGHGTMTASRMAGAGASLCPECRIVSIEGLGAASVRWAAERGWIDLQTNSWVSLVPNAPVPPGTLPPFIAGGGASLSSTSDAFTKATEVMLTFAASGNGAGYVAGFAPTPTYGMATAPAGVILVGGHDNGHATPWAGAPAHVVADAYAGIRATRDTLDELGPGPVSCCTSAAAPYAAGGAAAIVLEARRILGDRGVGLRGDALAIGHATIPARGPLSDGKLTLTEAKTILLHAATARPDEGPHDGWAHWTADPASESAGEIATYGPGANPFCQGCVTAPLPYALVPDDVPLYALLGYGAVDDASDRLARAALAGRSEIPARDLEDALYARDQAIRDALA